MAVGKLFDINLLLNMMTIMSGISFTVAVGQQWMRGIHMWSRTVFLHLIAHAQSKV